MAQIAQQEDATNTQISRILSHQELALLSKWKIVAAVQERRKCEMVVAFSALYGPAIGLNNHRQILRCDLHNISWRGELALSCTCYK